MSTDKHKWLIRGGVVIVGIGMAVSAPAALSQDWLAVLSYLSITAAGLMMVITGVSRRNAAESRTNHATVMHELAFVRSMQSVLAGHEQKLDDHEGRLLLMERALVQMHAKLAELLADNVVDLDTVRFIKRLQDPPPAD